MTAARIVVLNAGSSSLKASLIETPGRTLARAETSWGSDASRVTDRSTGVAEVLRELAADGVAGRPPDAIGYRVVHGGDRFTTPVVIDTNIIAGIEAVRELAPLHNAVALETIAAARSLLAEARHVACFDTAFHATLAPETYRYPLPEHWYTDWGVRRFGFHGLSVSWSLLRAGQLLGQATETLSLVVAHLGSGASATAVHNGRSLSTTMGLTPLEGLMMGTRAGSIDPGVLLYAMRRGELDAAAVGDALDHASGLAAVSGLSGDMRELEAAAAGGHVRARLAIDMFIDRAASWIAAMATALPRLDGLVFTGGIGEHSDFVRRHIVARLAVLGLDPLPEPSATAMAPEADGFLSAPAASIPVLRIEAREDLVIAAQTAELLAL